MTNLPLLFSLSGVKALQAKICPTNNNASCLSQFMRLTGGDDGGPISFRDHVMGVVQKC